MQKKLVIFTVLAVVGVIGAGSAVAGEPADPGCFGEDRSMKIHAPQGSGDRAPPNGARSPKAAPGRKALRTGVEGLVAAVAVVRPFWRDGELRLVRVPVLDLADGSARPPRARAPQSERLTAFDVEWQDRGGERGAAGRERSESTRTRGAKEMLKVGRGAAVAPSVARSERSSTGARRKDAPAPPERRDEAREREAPGTPCVAPPYRLAGRTRTAPPRARALRSGGSSRADTSGDSRLGLTSEHPRQRITSSCWAAKSLSCTHEYERRHTANNGRRSPRISPPRLGLALPTSGWRLADGQPAQRRQLATR